jgi:hypothetical protein
VPGRLAGDLTAAAVVIAATGVLRLPEIRSSQGATAPTASAPGAPSGAAPAGADGGDEEPQGEPDTVAEYFLVGTFTSWLLALVVAGLVGLAA